MRLQADLFYLIVYGPGYGESIVLRDPDLTWLVVDGCLALGRSPAAELLDQHNAKWSCVVLSHPHLDHARGLDAVLARPGRGPIGCTAPLVQNPDFWLSSQDPERHDRAGSLEHVLAAIEDRWSSDPESRWEMWRGDERQLGELELTVLHPAEEVQSAAASNPNRLSTGLLVTWRGVRVLLGSDVIGVDWASIAEMFPSLHDHVGLKFPHHGSEGALHSSWGDGKRARLWVMTPYNRGLKLPSYEDGRGLHWALQRVDSVHLTGLPLKHSLQGRVPYETTRRSLLASRAPEVEFQQIGSLRFELQPETLGVAGECFVAAGFAEDGALIDLQHGPGAVVVREEVGLNSTSDKAR